MVVAVGRDINTEPIAGIGLDLMAAALKELCRCTRTIPVTSCTHPEINLRQKINRCKYVSPRVTCCHPRPAGTLHYIARHSCSDMTSSITKFSCESLQNQLDCFGFKSTVSSDNKISRNLDRQF